MSDDLKKKYVDLGDGKKKLRRVGSDEQWKERDEMQIANTASALRRRVVEEIAIKNGH